jgi:hypothetical protein
MDFVTETLLLLRNVRDESPIDLYCVVSIDSWEKEGLFPVSSRQPKVLRGETCFQREHNWNVA